MIEYRQPKQNAYCSCCDKKLERNKDYGISFRGKRSKQGVIFLCNKCITAMNCIKELGIKEEKINVYRIK